MTSRAHGKTWIVTGASRGFGRLWCEAALDRGDRVVATARDETAIADLVERYPDQAMALALDVTDRAAVLRAVQHAVDRFGRLDVVVGNAGFGLFGAVEEVTEAQARQQLDVNVLGAVWLLQAVAPVLRVQGGGHVLLTSSFGGLVSFATAALYGASKYALEGLGESFAMEMADFGTRVTLIEPAAYATDFGGPSAVQATQLAAYDGARARTGELFGRLPPGDPRHTVDAVLGAVDSDRPPLRLMLGAHVRSLVLDTYAERVRTWQQQAAVSDQAQ